MKKFENKDYEKIRNVQGLKLSPEGGRALFSVQRYDIAKDAYLTDLHVCELDGGRIYRLTTGGREGGGFWLDENRVLFPAARGGEAPVDETILYCIDVRGGEAFEYLRVPIAGAQCSPLPDGRFLVRAETDANAPGEGEQDGWMYFDEYPFMDNGAGYVNRKRRSLFVYDPESGDLKRLTPPLMQTYAPYFSEDVVLTGDGFCFVGWEYDRCAAGHAAIYRHVWATGENIKLCSDRCYVYSLFEREGRIWYAAWAIEPGPYLAETRLRSVSLAGGDLRTEAEPEFETGTVRSREGETLFIRADRARMRLGRFTAGAAFEDIDTGELNPTCAIPRGGDIVLTGWYPDRLAELYYYKDGAIEQLTDFNGPLYGSCGLSSCEALSVQAGEGEVSGWVMKPAGFAPGGKYPAILDIHGGPHGYVNTLFNPEHQRWCAEGYFVFFCNPQGSTSFGRGHLDVCGDLGGRDYRELMAFTGAVLEKYPEIDAKRLGVTGQSYGGIMTNWIIGHTDRFAAAVPRMSASNWISMHATSSENWYGDLVLGAGPLEDLELVWRQSALKYAGAVKTPTLFIQHELDRACPLEQAEQMFVALLERGVPTRLLVNKRCFHGGRRVSQLLHDVDAMLAWFGRYLGGEGA